MHTPLYLLVLFIAAAVPLDITVSGGGSASVSTTGAPATATIPGSLLARNGDTITLSVPTSARWTSNIHQINTLTLKCSSSVAPGRRLRMAGWDAALPSR